MYFKTLKASFRTNIESFFLFFPLVLSKIYKQMSQLVVVFVVSEFLESQRSSAWWGIGDSIVVVV